MYLLGAPHPHWVQWVLGVRMLSSVFSPSIWLCRAGGQNGCSGGIHPPPLRKMTSWSFASGSPFPTGFPHSVGGGSLGGAFSFERVTSLWRSSMSCHNSSSARSPRFACSCCRVLPPWWGLLGDNGVPPPHQRVEVGQQKVPHLPLPYKPSQGWQKVGKS